MKRRQWKSEKKAMNVLEGLKGRPVAELRTAHQINQAQYYQWRDQFSANAGRAFETHTHDQRMKSLQRENIHPKGVIGELTVELKKTMRDGHEAGAICESRLVERRSGGRQPPPQNRSSFL
jgi:transposase-like protein